ncbi:MAG TPA: beta-ketoacyl synthase N-terminal-like domain-containing protein [Pilimelia sp.]|nr:beta-ketoacyl synthase N-terminal-like domain-containing protein [Pilimelia sp.]
MSAAGAGAGDGALVLSAWSAVSPFGIGAAAWTAGLAAGAPRGATAACPPEPDAAPVESVALVPDFSAAGHLGRKGTRTMDRQTGLAVAAVNGLVAECGPDLTRDPERVGLVFGTGFAGLDRFMALIHESLTGARPYHVDSAKFPSAVMNKAAAHCAIWHGVRGPNTTVTGDWLSGILALSYAVRLHRAGHCDRVLLGAVEEFSTARAWLEWHADSARAAVLGEGSVAFVLETAAQAAAAGRRPHAAVLGTGFRAYAGQGQAAAALAGCLRETLARHGRRPADVAVVSTAGLGGDLGAAEAAALDEVCGADTERLTCRPLVGETAGVSTGFQLAALLARGAGRQDPGRVAVVTGIGRDHSVGCAVIGGVVT